MFLIKIDTNLLPGNELKLSCKDPNWSAKGHVVKVTASKAYYTHYGF